MQVLVRDNNVDQALKALKKKMQREGIFREMKLRGHYEKPSERKAREKAEAIRRARKLARKKLQREGLLPMKPKPTTGAVRAPARSGPPRDAPFRLRAVQRFRDRRGLAWPAPFFWRAGVLSFAPMTGCGNVPCQAASRRSVHRQLRRAAAIALASAADRSLAALALAGCTTLGNPPAADNDSALYAPSQSNLASLSEVIDKASRRSAGLQYARLGLWRGRPQRSGAGRFQQGDQPRSQLRAGLCQSRADLSQDRAGSTWRSPTTTRRSRSTPIYAPAYLGRGIVYREQGHSAPGARRFQQGDRAQARQCRGLLQSRPALSEPAASTSSPSTISRPRSGSPTQKAEPYVARALSYLAIGDNKSAADDLDQAVQLDPHGSARLGQPRPRL